jgi:hypothetical protein
MQWFRSRSSHDGREPRTRRLWAFAAPGTRARRSGPPGLTRARFATRMLLLVALAASSLALTQCRMVGDTLTGVRVDAFKRKGDCLKVCKDTNKNDRKAEMDLYASNISECGANAACRAAENARHDAALQAINAAYAACQNSCHSQGGGTVGN